MPPHFRLAPPIQNPGYGPAVTLTQTACWRAGEFSRGADRTGEPGARGVRQREDHTQQQLLAFRTRYAYALLPSLVLSISMRIASTRAKDSVQRRSCRNARALAGQVHPHPLRPERQDRRR